MSQQHQHNVCLCERAIISPNDCVLKDMGVNTKQRVEIFAKRLFGITEVDHIILHHIELLTITYPLCLS